ncbi:hypothetical protein SLE2022_216000 [Rubroshorea leprosula]
MSNLAQILRLSSRFGCSFLQVTGDLTPSPNPMGIWRLELQRFGCSSLLIVGDLTSTQTPMGVPRLELQR